MLQHRRLLALLPLLCLGCESAQESSPPALSSVAPSAPATAIVVTPIDLEEEPTGLIPDVQGFFWEEELDYSQEIVDLGRVLFHDTRLSGDNTLSCASCHDLRYAGVDRARTGTGISGTVLPINTPTVFNAALSLSQFWDGRAADLETQADGPPNAEAEMGSSWEEIIGKLTADTNVLQALKAAYPNEISGPEDVADYHLRKAIADFQRTLLTVNSPFDEYLAGDESAISQEAREGYQVFKDMGCADCHYGPGIGGRSYQPLGRKRDFFAERGVHHKVDFGRFNVTGDDRDKHIFKVPSLRNVTLTGPYFHDGSMETLEEAVRAMGLYQIGEEMTVDEVRRILAFLDTLVGEFEGKSLNAHQNVK